MSNRSALDGFKHPMVLSGLAVITLAIVLTVLAYKSVISTSAWVMVLLVLPGFFLLSMGFKRANEEAYDEDYYDDEDDNEEEYY